MIKSCLKSNQPTPAPSPGPDNTSLSKCVAFCPKGQEVWAADEWDRTPTEPVRKLSYQDMLELKEIQKSLPRAAQPIDITSRRPFHNQYLSKVPVGLLPLLPDSTSTTTPPPTTETTTNTPDTPPSTPTPVTYSAPSSLFPRGFAIKSERAPSPPLIRPPVQQPIPRHLAHLTPAHPAPQPRKRSTLQFVPLLDDPIMTTTVAGLEDPPTPSLTNASLDSSPNPSPRSHPSDSPDTPSFIQLPPVGDPASYFPPFRDTDENENDHNHNGEEVEVVPMVMSFKRASLAPLSSPALLPPSPLSLSAPKEAKRRKQVIVINDIEMELDEDEPEEEIEEVVEPLKATSRTMKGFQFLPVNGSGS